MQEFAKALIAIWTGSLLTACGLVAPIAFAVLDNRQAAGKITGTVFRVQGWIGLAVLALALYAWWKVPNRPFGTADYVLLALAAVAPWVGAIALHPAMEKARALQDMKMFGMLHGVSGVLFAIACIAGLALTVLLSRRAG